MRGRPYGAILADLAAAVDFIESLGVSTAGSRFQAYRERLERLISIAPDKDGPVAPRLHPFSALDYVVTLTESHELGTNPPLSQRSKSCASASARPSGSSPQNACPEPGTVTTGMPAAATCRAVSRVGTSLLPPRM